MELDEFKSMWQAAAPYAKTDEQIRAMLTENKHPVLKSIRKQFVIELTGWSAFLICYYSMFDGANKPLFINLTLIISVIVPFVHNLYGYNFAKYLIDGDSLKDTLEKYLQRLKRYAVQSVVSRFLFTGGLLLFFSYNIRRDEVKYTTLAIMILLVVVVQMIVITNIWAKRIRILRQTLYGFS